MMKGILPEIYGVGIFEDVYTPDKIAHQEEGENRIFVSTKVYKALQAAKDSKEIEKVLKGVKVIEIPKMKLTFDLEIEPESKLTQEDFIRFWVNLGRRYANHGAKK